jgi:hypothetical protein
MDNSKRKILIYKTVVICLILLLSGCTFNVGKTTEIEPSFEMVKWGMSKNEVMRSESHEFIKEIETESTERLLFKGKIEDVDFFIMYLFIDGKLVNLYYFQDNQRDPSLTLEEVSKMNKYAKKELIKKFGKPIESSEHGERWEIDDSAIDLFYTEESGYVSFLIQYGNYEFYKKLMKNKK